MSLQVVNPYNNKIITSIKETKKTEIQKILKNCYKFKSTLNLKKKQRIFSNLIRILNKERENLAKLICLEVGVSIKDAKYEVNRVISCAKNAINVCKLIDQDQTNEFIFNKKESVKLKVISEPLDLVIAITPFNLPMILAAHKIFPAIISGTSLVLKPSEHTPLSSKKLIEILKRSGMPNNLVKIVFTKKGKDFFEQIVRFRNFNLINFTGSSEVGKKIMKELAKKNLSLKKTMLELGGNSPVIICNDCDIKKAVQVVIDGCFKYSGQRCTSARRIIVENAIAKKFIQMLVKEVKKIKYGDPFNKKNQMGCLINQEATKKIKDRVRDALKNGAKLIYGNEYNNSLFSPTILDFVKNDMKIVQSETFGPICSIIRSKNFSNSINIASDTKFKMAGSIMTNDKRKSKLASEKLKFGQFSLNGPPGYRTELAPFGGFGESGNGEKEGLILSSRLMRRIRVIYRH